MTSSSGGSGIHRKIPKVANKTFSKKYLTQPNSCDKVQSSTRAQLVEQQKSPCANKGRDNWIGGDYMNLKGFDVPDGFMGWVDSIQRYMLFASYRDYREYLEP